MKKLTGGIIVAIWVLANAAQAGTLENTLARDEVKCGALGTIAGFSALGDDGKWSGLDTDTCRAITALVAGEVDVLPFATTHTLTRDGSLGMDFTYYN